MSRLAQGGLIDRTSPVRFTFDGKTYRGFEGDTLASALLANDVKLVGRSFKYHRPRGVLTAGPEEPNALVTVGDGAWADPNVRATTLQLCEGLAATSQNRWPSLGFDLMAVNSLLAPFFVAGFYYKTFMWPARLWEKLYEPLIRRAAGLGALSGQPDPDAYDRAHAFCDLLVVGGGPAGLAAALAAARAGLRTIVIEDDWLLGGRLLAERHEIDDAPALRWAEAAEAELRGFPNVQLLTRTAVFGAYDGGEYAAVERIGDDLPARSAGQPRQRYWKIVAKRAILATGATERPLVFGGNDRPGVMTASALQAYANRFGVSPGRRIALFTTSDSGWSAAADLLAAGVQVAAVIDPREVPPSALREKITSVGVEVLAGNVVTAAHGRSLRSIDVRDSAGRRRRIAVDILGMAGGWNPSLGMGSHLGARPVWSDAVHAFLLDQLPGGIRIAGAAAGRFSLAEALADGAAAGAEAAGELGCSPVVPDTPHTSDDPVALAPLWSIVGTRGKAFVDFQHDVTAADIALSAREGFRSVEHLKRYTTLGMATDQGRIGQVNGQALLALHSGKTMAEAGTILSRPPYQPVAIGLLAGAHRDDHFRPTRLTPSHAWAAEQGARFVDAGAWKRAQWFALPGEQDWLETVKREVLGVRTRVGVCDVSTLGKIEIMGPDAGILMDRLYINAFSTLAVGRARYGVMLREDGFVLDDGTASRFAEDHYFVTTTTANAVRVMQHVDFARQVLWPELDVHAVSATEQWAQYAVAGPHSRDLLQALLPHLDLSNQAFPYMAALGDKWRGSALRLYRLSFSGELAYEIAVPAQYGDALVRALSEAGQAFGLLPYGTEALSVMRIEKGHAAGGELNGQTTAGDLGLGRMLSTTKDYIGRVMAQRPGLVAEDRPALVGVKPLDASARLSGGAHLLHLGAKPTAADDQGYVTSVAFSPMLGQWIGLALAKGGSARVGERLRAVDLLRDSDVEVEMCAPVFFDPEGRRLRG